MERDGAGAVATLFALWDGVPGLDGAEGHALCGGCGGFAAVGLDYAAVGLAPREILRHMIVRFV